MSDDAINLRRIVVSNTNQSLTWIGPVYGTLWADAGDHSKTFGKSDMGCFAWKMNMWPFISLLYGPIERTATVYLKNGSGTILTQASITFPAEGGVVKRGQSAYNCGIEYIEEFNAITIDISFAWLLLAKGGITYNG